MLLLISCIKFEARLEQRLGLLNAYFGCAFDSHTPRKRSVETWKNSANAFACILLMGRRPLMASDALPLDPNRCRMSFCFRLRASIKCCNISCGAAGSIG